MGFTPDQVRAMSVAEFNLCLEGWREAHGLAKDEPMSRDRLEELKEMYPD